MKLRIFTVILASLFATPSLAYTAEQEAALDNVADILVADRGCPTLKVNPRLLSVALMTYGLGADADLDEVERRILAKESRLESVSADILCVTGKMLYGESGSRIPGALVPE